MNTGDTKNTRKPRRPKRRNNDDDEDPYYHPTNMTHPKQDQIDHAAALLTEAATILGGEDELLRETMAALYDEGTPQASAVFSLFDASRAEVQETLWEFQKATELAQREVSRQALDNDLDSDAIDFVAPAGFVSHRNDIADNRTKLEGCKGFISVDDSLHLPSMKNGGR